jgi:hypothetical protein
MRIWISAGGVVAMALAFGWASDAITIQGERTVYTVECAGGQWDSRTCTGKLTRGDRYRFRVLSAHGEVLSWVVGAPGQSDKFSGCEIEDGRNWACPPEPKTSRAFPPITYRMVHGTPAPGLGGNMHPFHAVAKWRWWLAGYGLPIGSEADE